MSQPAEPVPLKDLVPPEVLDKVFAVFREWVDLLGGEVLALRLSSDPFSVYLLEVGTRMPLAAVRATELPGVGWRVAGGYPLPVDIGEA